MPLLDTHTHTEVGVRCGAVHCTVNHFIDISVPGINLKIVVTHSVLHFLSYTHTLSIALSAVGYAANPRPIQLDGANAKHIYKNKSVGQNAKKILIVPLSMLDVWHFSSHSLRDLDSRYVDVMTINTMAEIASSQWPTYEMYVNIMNTYETVPNIIQNTTSNQWLLMRRANSRQEQQRERSK